MNFSSSFPIYKQYDAMDCGPACLRMISKYYGKAYSLQYLREKSYVTREGASLVGLRDAAASIGMMAKCALASLDYLLGEATLPCIAHWDNNHFVVVYRARDNHIYVADPAYGKAMYDKDKFLSHWAAADDEGYVLLLEPGTDFHLRQEVARSGKSLFSLFSYWKSYRQLLGQLLIAMLLGSVIQLILPFLTQMIVDKGIRYKNISFLYLILLGEFILIASRVFVNFIRGWILFYISTPINITLVHDFLIKLTKLPLGYFDVKKFGDTLQRVTDHQRVETFFTNSVLSNTFTVINIIVFGIVLTIYSFQIFLIFATGTILYLLWIQLFLKKRREIDFVRFRQMAKSYNIIIQLIMGMQEIRLANYERRKVKDWINAENDLFLTGKKSLSLTQNQQSGCTLLQETQNILITFLAARSVISGDITLGMMLAIQFIIGQLNGPVEQLVNFSAAAQDATISFERIEEIHSMPNEEDADDMKIRAIPQAADIIISNLSFQYGDPYSTKVLSNVSLVLPNKKTTAIVGASGSGKTTLLKLLLGVYQPVSGEITIGDHPMKNLAINAWRKECAFVMQDGYIFSDTIADNIALSDGVIDQSRLKQSARVANIDEFIESLPLGYKTLMGADGQGLSQGQKQRILIARAVYKNPKYVFFDEATNALDASNEYTIMKNLDLFFKNRTVVIVAHRLSTVKNADQIIVLDKGTVIETGTHNELTIRKGAYYNLVKNQLELGT
jgi:ATP-binding cassette, subfamily B, bacterial